jgi:hypothetical protein
MRRGILCVAIMVMLVGCGRKTPPVPPNAVIPQAISNLEYKADDTGVTLTWTYPERSIDGRSIDNIRTFHLHKAMIPEPDYCEGCPVAYDQIIKVDGRDTEPKGKLTYMDTDLQPGYHYVYMVQSDSGWRIKSAESNRVDFSQQATLLSPMDVKVATGDQVLTLSWLPVATREDGSDAVDVKYQVYRGTSPTALAPIGEMTPEPRYVDRGIANEQIYYYNVRAVTFQTAGYASKTVSGMALDMVPPVPPRNVKVLGLPQGIQLHWTPSTDTDLGGYRVYHQKEGDEGWKQIGTAPKGAIGFKDITPLTPGIHYFVVTSFDLGTRQNESEYSLKVRYTAP